MSDHATETLVRPTRRTATEARSKPQPRYHVVLWDDQDHTYPYVMRMVMELFARSEGEAYEAAQTVDRDGRVILLTTTKEHAELKRDQIHAYGRDPLVERCVGAMTATIEPTS